MKRELKERYSDEELEEFRAIIEEKMKSAEKQFEMYRNASKNGSYNGTDDTAPTFKSFDEGSNTMSRETNNQFAIRQERFMRDLKAALMRIDNKSYGICRVTGKLISKERLRLVPHATLSIEAKNMQKS